MTLPGESKPDLIPGYAAHVLGPSFNALWHEQRRTTRAVRNLHGLVELLWWTALAAAVPALIYRLVRR
jgi:hypothetical protein